MPVRVEVQKLTKKFGTFTALYNLNAVIEPGELFFLLGPSGCGKTTLLRCIAGFNNPDSGRICIGGHDVTSVPPHKRDTGMVFQSYALWPHMTLAQNVAFGLEMRQVSKPERSARVKRALELVHLNNRADVKPNELSGGQQQRVALARALVVEPKCLLLDEPLSNLDAGLRIEMRMEIRRICKELGLTAIYVTHDQKEALSIADRMAVMHAGMIEQIGTPEQIYRYPVNRFTAGFIGEGNFITGHVSDFDNDSVILTTSLGTLVSRAVCTDLKAGDPVAVCLRPESIRFDHAGEGCPNRFSGTFKECIYLGEIAQHLIQLNSANSAEFELKAFELNPRKGSYRINSHVELWIDPESVIVTALS